MKELIYHQNHTQSKILFKSTPTHSNAYYGIVNIPANIVSWGFIKVLLRYGIPSPS
jgi:hypothetical protein